VPASTSDILPEDGTSGTLIGRVWRKGKPSGPSVVAVRADGVYDITSAAAPTVADLCNAPDPVTLARNTAGHRLGALKDLSGDLLAPIDLQAIKAAGVTFAVSLLERLIEEHAKGDPARAEQVRKELNQIIGADVSTIKPGSTEAEALKKTLMARGAWSPYLEVGIGPYAEIFTKAPAMAAVGYGAEIGIRSDSDWNNPEPEVTLVVNARGQIVGATLGNDVNLRDMEGRSALLLGKAKDNNASCAIGPFIRLFDDHFGMEDVRHCELAMQIEGTDGFRLGGHSSMAMISRDPLDLVGQPRPRQVLLGRASGLRVGDLHQHRAKAAQKRARISHRLLPRIHRGQVGSLPVRGAATHRRLSARRSEVHP
jgi:fumarylacetoacetate (FAA) hydrolase family protein